MNPLLQIEVAMLEHKERLQRYQSNYRPDEPKNKLRFSLPRFSLKLNRSQSGAVHKAQHSLS